MSDHHSGHHSGHHCHGNHYYFFGGDDSGCGLNDTEGRILGWAALIFGVVMLITLLS